MIRGLIAILFFQGAGELLARGLSAPVPGPVLGMLLLLSALLFTNRCPDELARVSDSLLQHLGLLFIPAAVGVLVYLTPLRQHAFPLALLLLASTLSTVAVTGLAVRLLSRNRNTHEPPDG